MHKMFALNSCTDFLVGKFFHFTTFCAYQVVVNDVAKCFFVLSQLLAKLMFDNQPALQQQFQRIVNCSQTYPVFFLHGIVE